MDHALQLMEHHFGLFYTEEYNTASQTQTMMNMSSAMSFQLGNNTFSAFFMPLFLYERNLNLKEEHDSILSSSLSSQGEGQSGTVLASNLETFLVCILLKWITFQFFLYGLKIANLIRERSSRAYLRMGLNCDLFFS